MSFMRNFANDDVREEPEEITITVSRIESETDKGIKIRDPQGNYVWLPKSRIKQQRTLTGEIDIIVPMWLAKANFFDRRGF